MIRKFCLTISCLCAWCVEQTYAGIVINEFLPDLPSDLDEKQEEWVELYNNGDSSVDLKGYLLEDEKHKPLVVTTEYVLGETTTIEAGSFIVIIRRGSLFSLNNDLDTVYLFESTESAEPVDVVAYEKAKTSKSFGRIPDGTGDFVAHLEPTKGYSNNITEPVQESTPTPISVSQKSYPSVAPVAAVDPVPLVSEEMPTQQPTVYASPLAIKISPESREITFEPVEASNSASSSGFVLPTTDGLYKKVADEEQSNAVVLGLTENSKKTKQYPFFLAGGGLSFLTLAIFRGYKYFQLDDE